MSIAIPLDINLTYRTVLGRSLARICLDCDMSECLSCPTPSQIQNNMKYFNIPDQGTWRTGLIMEILNEGLTVPGFTEDKL